MAQRFYSEAGRIIFSKPGYNASPSLPDIFKIFDSAWSFGYVLIASGSVGVSVGTHTISFPAQHFIPTIEFTVYESRSGIDFLNFGSLLDVTTNSFTVQITDNDAYRLEYNVFGISQ